MVDFLLNIVEVGTYPDEAWPVVNNDPLLRQMCDSTDWILVRNHDDSRPVLKFWKCDLESRIMSFIDEVVR